jgi:hypothetical protein
VKAAVREVRERFAHYFGDGLDDDSENQSLSKASAWYRDHVAYQQPFHTADSMLPYLTFGWLAVKQMCQEKELISIN